MLGDDAEEGEEVDASDLKNPQATIHWFYEVKEILPHIPEEVEDENLCMIRQALDPRHYVLGAHIEVIELSTIEGSVIMTVPCWEPPTDGYSSYSPGSGHIRSIYSHPSQSSGLVPMEIPPE